jgi:hypothetical protein
MRPPFRAVLGLLVAQVACSCSGFGEFWKGNPVEGGLSPEKAITAFSLPSLALTGLISGTSITLYSESTAVLSAQAAVFTTTGKLVTVNGVEQVSGATLVDFTAPVSYLVTAADGSTQTYIVYLLAPKLVPGMSAWYKADAQPYSDGFTIATWSDSSGNGNNLAQSYGTKPVYRSSILNGKPVGRFTRTGTTDGIYSNAVTGFTGNSFTYFLVFRRTAYNTQEQYVFYLNDGSAGCSGTALTQSIQAGSAGTLLVNRPCNTYYVTSGPDFTDTVNFHILAVRYDFATSRSQQYLDGAAIFDQTIASQSLPSVSQFMLGNYDHNSGAGDRVFDGDLAELIFYSSALSDANLSRICRYLSEKYSLGYTCQ